MSKLIKNNDFIRNKIEECIELRLDEINDLFEVSLNEDYLSIDFIKQLKNIWNKHNKEPKLYIHQLLSTTELYLPCLEKAVRDPILEKRIEQIKAQLDEAAYQKMVYDVDLNSPLRYANDNGLKSGIMPEFKTMQGQVIAVFNSFACIIAAFFFGYKSVQYSLDVPDITKQMVGGIILALIVAIADFYFLFKKLLRLDSDYEQQQQPHNQKSEVNKKKISNKEQRKSKTDKKKD